MDAPDGIFSERVSAGAKLLAVCLWGRVSESSQPIDGCTRVSVAKSFLRMRLGIPRTTLDRYFRELSDKGWLNLEWVRDRQCHIIYLMASPRPVVRSSEVVCAMN